MGGVVRRNPSLLAFLAVAVAIFACGWASLKDSADGYRRSLEAGEAEVDQLPLPSDWHLTRRLGSPTEGRVVNDLRWSRTYQAAPSQYASRSGRDLFEVYEIFVRAAVSAGYHRVENESELDEDFCQGRCGDFNKGRYDLTVSVERGCSAPPRVPTSAATSTSTSAAVEPECVTINVTLSVHDASRIGVG